MDKKVICFLIVICFLTISLNQCIANPTPLEDPTLLYYGFIVSSVRCENATIENQIFCKIRHLINDLLREDIPVYWTASNITLNISEVIIDEEFEIFFEKGSFIIPFTGDAIVDTKLIAIICDYNESSEIEDNNNIEIPLYLLRRKVTINAFNLSEVKIAQYKNFLTCGASWYSYVASKCGFLNFDFIRNMNTRKKLDNSIYNLLIWPGGDVYYPWQYFIFEIVLDLCSLRTNAIRRFVRNGGGFVGSCYAVNIAACGFDQFPINLSKLSQYPKLPSIGFLAITDIIYFLQKTVKSYEQKILDTNHPVAYGVDNYLYGAAEGLKFAHVGSSVDVIAEYSNDSKPLGTPSIVSNEFGKGRVVLFAPHPEARDPDTGPFPSYYGPEGVYNGKKLVTNAFYYATSSEEIEHEISKSRTLSFITEVWNKTKDLSSLLNEHEEVFKDIKTDINKSLEDIKILTNKTYSILKTIIQIAIDEELDINETKNALYYVGSKYLLYCVDLIKEYLENTSMTLKTIEKIYPLLKNDTKFIEQLEKLKNDLSSKTNEMHEILSTSLKKLQKIEDLLEFYKQHVILRNFTAKVIKKTSHDIEIQTELAFQLMPSGYFYSLKFLRHHWYNYEISLAMY